MKLNLSLAIVAANLFLAPSALAQQTLVVTSAANYYSGSVVAPGALAVATTYSLSTPPPAWTLDPSATSLTVNGASVPVIGSNNQRGLVFRMPPDTPTGAADVAVSFQEGGPPLIFHINLTASVRIADSNFYVFTAGNGYGPATAMNAITGQPVTLENPAHPGDAIAVWGTGLGTAAMDAVSVLVGGHPAQVTYAGPAPGFPGTDQVNFIVPNDPAIPDGCFVALQISSQSLYNNNIASLAKSSVPGPCNPPLDLSADDMAQLDAGGAIDVADYGINGTVAQNAGGGFVRTESFNANVYPEHIQTLSAFGLSFADDVFYSCTNIAPSITSPTGFMPDPYGSFLQQPLVISGPLNSTTVAQGDLNLPPIAPVSLPSQLPAPFFGPGLWQLSNASSNPYFQVQGSFAIPPQPALPETFLTQPIDRQNDLNIDWDPTLYGAADLITLTASSFSPAASYSSTCRAPAVSGHITIPAALLQRMPASPTGILRMMVSSRTGQQVRLDSQPAPSTSGLFYYYFQETLPVSVI